MDFKLPTSDWVVETHDLIIDSFGGLKGIPHPELIESALMRPQQYMNYDKNCDIHLVCAILLNSLATYHAFADGNKRTALIMTLLTYRMNGVMLEYVHISNNRLERLVLDVASKRIDIRTTRARLRRIVNDLEGQSAII